MLSLIALIIANHSQSFLVRIPGAYVNKNKHLCVGYDGDTCTQCAWHLGYYLYGNECVKFQNRTTDLVEYGPEPKLLRGM